MFNGAWIILTKYYKQMCLVKWLSKIWHTHVVEYSLVVKYNKFVLTRNDLKKVEWRKMKMVNMLYLWGF